MSPEENTSESTNAVNQWALSRMSKEILAYVASQPDDAVRAGYGAPHDEVRRLAGTLEISWNQRPQRYSIGEQNELRVHFQLYGDSEVINQLKPLLRSGWTVADTVLTLEVPYLETGEELASFLKSRQAEVDAALLLYGHQVAAASHEVHLLANKAFAARRMFETAMREMRIRNGSAAK